MTQFRYHVLTLLALLVCGAAVAQTASKSDEQLTERQKIRRERNFLEISAGLQGGLTNLNEAWIETSGGDNSVTLLTSLSLKHVYTKDKFSVQSLFNANFGYYNVTLENELSDGSIDKEAVWYKNQDEFQIDITPSYKATDNWSYASAVKFRSQFANGYVSSASQDSYNLKSSFMSPGYLDVSVGMLYTSPNKEWPFVITLSPVALSAIYVTNAEVKQNAQYDFAAPSAGGDTYTKVYGVSPCSSSVYEGGSSIQISYDRKFGEREFLRYTTTLHSFYGWMTQLGADNSYGSKSGYESAVAAWDGTEESEPSLSIRPTVRWDNKIEIKASKLLTTTLNFQLYYNRAQCFKVQNQTLLTVGLAYTFANKKL